MTNRSESDFWVTFGSNAREFSTQLPAQLAGARTEIAALKADINTLFSEASGASPSLAQGLIAELQGANREISGLTAGISRMASELDTVIGKLRNLKIGGTGGGGGGGGSNALGVDIEAIAKRAAATAVAAVQRVNTGAAAAATSLEEAASATAVAAEGAKRASRRSRDAAARSQRAAEEQAVAAEQKAAADERVAAAARSAGRRGATAPPPAPTPAPAPPPQLPPRPAPAAKQVAQEAVKAASTPTAAPRTDLRPIMEALKEQQLHALVQGLNASIGTSIDVRTPKTDQRRTKSTIINDAMRQLEKATDSAVAQAAEQIRAAAAQVAAAATPQAGAVAPYRQGPGGTYKARTAVEWEQYSQQAGYSDTVEKMGGLPALKAAGFETTTVNPKYRRDELFAALEKIQATHPAVAEASTQTKAAQGKQAQAAKRVAKAEQQKAEAVDQMAAAAEQEAAAIQMQAQEAHISSEMTLADARDQIRERVQRQREMELLSPTDRTRKQIDKMKDPSERENAIRSWEARQRQRAEVEAKALSATVIPMEGLSSRGSLDLMRTSLLNDMTTGLSEEDAGRMANRIKRSTSEYALKGLLGGAKKRTTVGSIVDEYAPHVQAAQEMAAANTPATAFQAIRSQLGRTEEAVEAYQAAIGRILEADTQRLRETESLMRTSARGGGRAGSQERGAEPIRRADIEEVLSKRGQYGGDSEYSMGLAHEAALIENRRHDLYSFLPGLKEQRNEISSQVRPLARELRHDKGNEELRARVAQLNRERDALNEAIDNIYTQMRGLWDQVDKYTAAIGPGGGTKTAGQHTIPGPTGSIIPTPENVRSATQPTIGAVTEEQYRRMLPHFVGYSAEEYAAMPFGDLRSQASAFGIKGRSRNDIVTQMLERFPAGSVNQEFGRRSGGAIQELPELTAAYGSAVDQAALDFLKQEPAWDPWSKRGKGTRGSRGKAGAPRTGKARKAFDEALAKWDQKAVEFEDYINSLAEQIQRAGDAADPRLMERFAGAVESRDRIFAGGNFEKIAEGARYREQYREQRRLADASPGSRMQGIADQQHVAYAAMDMLWGPRLGLQAPYLDPSKTSYMSSDWAIKGGQVVGGTGAYTSPFPNLSRNRGSSARAFEQWYGPGGMGEGTEVNAVEEMRKLLYGQRGSRGSKDRPGVKRVPGLYDYADSIRTTGGALERFKATLPEGWSADELPQAQKAELAGLQENLRHAQDSLVRLFERLEQVRAASVPHFAEGTVEEKKDRLREQAQAGAERRERLGIMEVGKQKELEKRQEELARTQGAISQYEEYFAAEKSGANPTARAKLAELSAQREYMFPGSEFIGPLPRDLSDELPWEHRQDRQSSRFADRDTPGYRALTEQVDALHHQIVERPTSSARNEIGQLLGATPTGFTQEQIAAGAKTKLESEAFAINRTLENAVPGKPVANEGDYRARLAEIDKQLSAPAYEEDAFGPEQIAEARRLVEKLHAGVAKQLKTAKDNLAKAALVVEETPAGAAPPAGGEVPPHAATEVASTAHDAAMDRLIAALGLVEKAVRALAAKMDGRPGAAAVVEEAAGATSKARKTPAAVAVERTAEPPDLDALRERLRAARASRTVETAFGPQDLRRRPLQWLEGGEGSLPTGRFFGGPIEGLQRGVLNIERLNAEQWARQGLSPEIGGITTADPRGGGRISINAEHARYNTPELQAGLLAHEQAHALQRNPVRFDARLRDWASRGAEEGRADALAGRDRAKLGEYWEHLAKAGLTSDPKQVEQFREAYNKVHRAVSEGQAYRGVGAPEEFAAELKRAAADLKVAAAELKTAAGGGSGGGGGGRKKRTGGGGGGEDDRPTPEEQLAAQAEANAETNAARTSAEAKASARREELRKRLPVGVRQILDDAATSADPFEGYAKGALQLRKEHGYTGKSDITAVAEYAGLGDEDKQRLDVRASTLAKAETVEKERSRQAAKGLQDEAESARLASEAEAKLADTLGSVSAQTREAIAMARGLLAERTALRSVGSDFSPEQAGQLRAAQMHATAMIERDLSVTHTDPTTLRTRAVVPASDRAVMGRSALGVSGPEYTELKTASTTAAGRESMRSWAEGAAGEAPGVSSRLGALLFGGAGFGGRAIQAAGHAAVRFFSFGLVFGITNEIQKMIKASVETEAEWVRISDALGATGKSADGLRSALQGISSDLATPLEEVYVTASQLVGVFSNTADVEFATKAVEQLKLISRGALNAQEAITSLQSVSQAYGLTGGAAFQGLVDKATAIQNVTGANVENTLEGAAGLAPQAKQYGLSLNQALVYSGLVAQRTGQSGGAASEQLSRIFETWRAPKARDLFSRLGIGTSEQRLSGDWGAILTDIIQKRASGTLKDSDVQQITGLSGPRQARPATALIGTREEAQRTLQGLTAAENSAGAGTQRVHELMRQLNRQVQQLSVNFTNVGAALVRSGFLDGLQKGLELVNLMLKAMGKIGDVIAFLNKNVPGFHEFEKAIIWGGTFLVITKLIGAAMGLVNGQMKALRARMAGPVGLASGLAGGTAGAIEGEEMLPGMAGVGSGVGPTGRLGRSGWRNPGQRLLAIGGVAGSRALDAPLARLGGFLQAEGAGLQEAGQQGVARNTLDRRLRSLSETMERAGTRTSHLGDRLIRMSETMNVAGQSVNGLQGKLASKGGSGGAGGFLAGVGPGLLNAALIGVPLGIAAYQNVQDQHKQTEDFIKAQFPEAWATIQQSRNKSSVPLDPRSPADQMYDEATQSYGSTSSRFFRKTAGLGNLALSGLSLGMYKGGFGSTGIHGRNELVATFGHNYIPGYQDDPGIGPDLRAPDELRGELADITLKQIKGLLNGNVSLKDANVDFDKEVAKINSDKSLTDPQKIDALRQLAQWRKTVTEIATSMADKVKGLTNANIYTDQQIETITNLIGLIGTVPASIMSKFGPGLFASLETAGAIDRNTDAGKILASAFGADFSPRAIQTGPNSPNRGLTGHLLREEEERGSADDQRKAYQRGVTNRTPAQNIDFLTRARDAYEPILKDAQTRLDQAAASTSTDPAVLKQAQDDYNTKLQFFMGIENQIAQVSQAAAARASILIGSGDLQGGIKAFEDAIKVMLANRNKYAKGTDEWLNANAQVQQLLSSETDAKLSNNTTPDAITAATSQDPVARASAAARAAKATLDAHQQANKRNAGTYLPDQIKADKIAYAQAVQGVADANEAIANSVGALNQAGITDPTAKINAQITELNRQLKVAQGKGDTATANNLKAQIADAQDQAAQLANSITASYAALVASKEKDPFKRIQAQIAELNRQIGIARGRGDQEQVNSLLGQLNDAKQQAAQLAADSAEAQTNLLIAIANAGGFTVRAAQYGLDQANKAYQKALKDNGGNKKAPAVINAQAAVVAARANVRDTWLQDREDDLAFQHDMGQITLQQYRTQLQELLKRKDLTKKQRQEIQKTLHDMSKESEGMWNLGDIKMPTPYEVRRSMQTGTGAARAMYTTMSGSATGSSIGYQDNKQVQINIYGGNLAQVQQVMTDQLGASATGRLTVSTKKV